MNISKELLRVAKDLIAGSYDRLKATDKVLVYHGTQMNHIPAMINGFDANKKMSRHFNTPSHAGIFVAPDLAGTKSFGIVVLEIAVRADDLHGTNYAGKIIDSDTSEWDWLKEQYPNSFRPGLSYTMDKKRAEPQAILRGRISPSQIKRVNYNGKWLSRRSFLKLVDERDAGMDLSNPNYDIEEFFLLLSKSLGKPKNTLIKGFRNLSEDKREWQLKNLNFGNAAVDSYLKKMRDYFGE
jgi:hypothetical protein